MFNAWNWKSLLDNKTIPQIQWLKPTTLLWLCSWLCMGYGARENSSSLLSVGSARVAWMTHDHLLPSRRHSPPLINRCQGCWWQVGFSSLWPPHTARLGFWQQSSRASYKAQRAKSGTTKTFLRTKPGTGPSLPLLRSVGSGGPRARTNWTGQLLGA